MCYCVGLRTTLDGNTFKSSPEAALSGRAKRSSSKNRALITLVTVFECIMLSCLTESSREWRGPVESV